MPQPILLDGSLSWRQVSEVAEGAPLALSARKRRRESARRARSWNPSFAKGVRAYGVNTGVGALCDVVVTESKQEQLSRNIVMSHAVGVGPPLEATAVRAIIAAAINNFAHGFSGVRPAVVEGLLALLEHDCVPGGAGPRDRWDTSRIWRTLRWCCSARGGRGRATGR